MTHTHTHTHTHTNSIGVDFNFNSFFSTVQDGSTHSTQPNSTPFHSAEIFGSFIKYHIVDVIDAEKNTFFRHSFFASYMLLVEIVDRYNPTEQSKANRH